MKRTPILLLGLLLVAVAGACVAAQVDPDVVVFYREGCHDCERMDRVLEEMHGIYPNLTIRHIEEGDEDGPLMWSLASEYGVFPTKFPVIFVGDEVTVGIGLDKELRLRAEINRCMTSGGCASPLVRVEGPRIPWRSYLIGALIALALLLVVIETAGS